MDTIQEKITKPYIKICYIDWVGWSICCNEGCGFWILLSQDCRFWNKSCQFNTNFQSYLNLSNLILAFQNLYFFSSTSCLGSGYEIEHHYKNTTGFYFMIEFSALHRWGLRQLLREDLSVICYPSFLLSGNSALGTHASYS